MSPSFWTMAIATRLALPKTFSYSRYTFMYSCFSGTILLKPASTTMREADATKSSVSAAKMASQTLRWSKTILDAAWMRRSRVISALRPGRQVERPGTALPQHEDRVRRAQCGARERARPARVGGLEGLAVVARNEHRAGRAGEHERAVGELRPAHQRGLRG